MKGLERFTPGSGSHAVAAHLHEVADQALRDLVAAPDHQRLLVRNLSTWIDHVLAHRRAFDRQFITMLPVAGQVAFQPAPPSATGLPAQDLARMYRRLVEHGWLTRVPGTTAYRCQIGVPFGAPSTARSTR